MPPIDYNSLLSGAVGVAGGLGVYGLGQRASRDTRRHEASLTAAGDLLEALAAYDAPREGPPNSGVMSFTEAANLRHATLAAEQDAYRRLRVAAASNVPRLLDQAAADAVRALVASLKYGGARTEPLDQSIPNKERERLVDEELEQREVLKAAAEEALTEYLERAAAQ
jgi:hypothetical protein